MRDYPTHQSGISRGTAIARHRNVFDRKVAGLAGGLVLAAALSLGSATEASAQICNACIVTMQQVSNDRYADAYEAGAQDYRLVTRTWQNNDTQRWRLDHLGNNVYTIRQVSTGRYVDAHEDAGNDYGLVTRTAQNNNTQRWFFTSLGNSRFTIQQVSSGRYVDAHDGANEDYAMVTRTAQNNDTQRWRVVVVQQIFIPIPLPLPLPVPQPPPVHSSGIFNLMPAARVNLDNGQLGLQGADLMLQAVNFTQLQLSPQNGAQINFNGGAQRGWNGCSAAAFSGNPVPLNSISAGDYVCMRTSENRISEFQITAIGPILQVLTINYTTWQ